MHNETKLFMWKIDIIEVLQYNYNYNEKQQLSRK